MEDTLAVNPTDAFTNMAGLFQGSAQPVSPRINLRVKIAKMRAEQLREKREIDKATMPYVQQDIIESEQRQIDVQSKIDEALNALNAPAPTQQQGSNEAELYAAGIGGLLSGGNLPEVLNALARVSGARNEMEFDDKLRQYGLNRETVKVSLQQLLSNLEDEAGNEREMRRANAQAGYQAGQKQIERDDEWERMFAGAELDAEKLEFQQMNLNERAELKNIIDQLKIDRDRDKLELEKWKAENIALPDVQSKIKDREAKQTLARQKFEGLSAKDKASIAIQTQKLKAEFGRLSETQKRTIIAEKALGMTGYNAETGRFNAELRAWEGQMRALGLFEQADTFWEMLIRPEAPPMPQAPSLDLGNSLKQKPGSTKPVILSGPIGGGLPRLSDPGHRSPNTKTKVHNGWVYELRKDGWHPVRKA